MNKPIQRVPVESSYIKSIGYDPSTQKMHLEFHGEGKVYEYSDVPLEAHLNLRNSDSIGKYFRNHIQGKFGHRLV